MRELVCIGELDRPYRQFPWHRHPYAWEVVCYLEGSGTLWVGDHRFPFQEGQVFVLPPAIPHCEESPNGFRDLFLLVSSVPVELRKTSPIEDTSEAAARSLMAQLLREYRGHRPNRENILAAILKLLLHYLISQAHPQGALSDVKRVMSLISENLSNPHFAVCEALKALPLSEDYLRRLFRQEIGMSPHEYLMELRLERACELLAGVDGDERVIKEIARDCGFDDPMYFSRMFRKKKGVSPSRWKNTQLEGTFEYEGEMEFLPCAGTERRVQGRW